PTRTRASDSRISGPRTAPGKPNGATETNSPGARNRKHGERFGRSVQRRKKGTFAVMGIATAHLTAVEQTAFLTEYARALDSRWPRPILGDSLADDAVGK